MAVESENVERLIEWLADGGPVRSANGAADTLVAKLATLVFGGDAGWPDHADRVIGYRDALRERFANDGGRESQFVSLTGQGADPGMFVDWFAQVVGEWENRPAGDDAGAPSGGLPNPNVDGTPGTEFYRFDDAKQEYQFSASADGTDWATYDQRRYAEPVRDENYGLTYRFDRKDNLYQWHDEATGTWQDQAWADRHAANRAASQSTSNADAPATGAQPAWDENWKMFYRVGDGGAYEFADAVTRGDRSSGCGDVWLSQEQVSTRASGEQMVPAHAIEKTIESEVAAAVAEIEGAEKLTPRELDEIRAELLAEFTARPATTTAGGV
jgi:hypothetical protein